MNIKPLYETTFFSEYNNDINPVLEAWLFVAMKLLCEIISTIERHVMYNRAYQMP